MRTKQLTTALFLFFTLIAFSQTAPGAGAAIKEVTVSGIVVDKETNQPLEYATIAFYDVRRERIETGGITDLEGKFSIPVKTGTYNISIEYISYKTITLSNRTIEGDLNLGTFYLELDIATLDAVEIIAEKTTVEIKLDKKIYNVGKDLTVSGGTVSDVLDNVPSVSVDVEGNVALRGNNNVRILINGRPSGLVGLNSTDALRQLPAEAIERVEVITSPSARYDAEGTAGILNIILRRSKLLGLNGAITANAGYPENAGLSGNINFRTGDFNFFNTSSYRYRDILGESSSDTEFLLSGATLDERRNFDRIRRGLTTNIGVEWYLEEFTSLTASFVLRDGNNASQATNRSFGVNPDLSEYTFLRVENEGEDDSTIQYGLNFDKQFDGNSEHRLTADFQYETNKEDEFGLIRQDGLFAERVTTLERQDRVLLQADFIKPVGEKSSFEAGYRGNLREIDTDFALEFFTDGDFVLNEDVSNRLVYTEYVNAFYTQYGSKIKDKLSFLFGLRYEDTYIEIDQRTSNERDTKKYGGLFPTGNIGYELSEDQNLTFGYNRRIRRPRSRFINPFPSRSSATNIFQGNPDIDPSYSNGFDLGYLNTIGKWTLNSSIFYTHSTDVFTFIQEDTGQTVIVNGAEIPVLRRFPVNLATNDRFGFEFTVTYRPSRKWNFNGNFNLFNSETRGDFNGTNFDASNLSWFVRFNNKLTLPGNIDWQTRLFYSGPNETAISRSEGIFSTDLAFSKDVFKDKGSLVLNVSDLFNSRKRRSETFTETFESDGTFQWRKRTITLSFTYRFNQKKNQRQRRQNGDDGDFDFEGS